MQHSRIFAAQRLQTWLLVAAMVSVLTTGLLVVDLVRNLRGTVIDETSRNLRNAVQELVNHSRTSWKWREGEIPEPNQLDQVLKTTSYDILRSYPDVEGGFVFQGNVVGHSFPTYTEPGSNLRQPEIEKGAVMEAATESQRTGQIAHRVVQDGSDLVLVTVLSNDDRRPAAWCLRRIFNFSDSSEITRRIVLICVMALALISIAVVLKFSFDLQRGFAAIQTGLRKLRADAGYRLSPQSHELDAIVKAINSMAEGRQAMEAELRREDRLRVMGRVVAGIAHEIRNPLNSIRLSIRVLAQKLEGNSDFAEAVEMATGEVDRLNALLNSLLVFRADPSAKIRPQAISPIIERTVAIVKPHADEQSVRILQERNAETEVLIDGDHLQQALMNVLLNAIDACGPGGEVSIVLHSEADEVLLDVKDSGPGLSEEQQEQLFETFYTTKAEGSGLGLAVTRTLLEKMDCSIESIRVEQGTCFRIRIPTTLRKDADLKYIAGHLA